MAKYSLQTKIFENFKIDFFSSFADHPEIVKAYVRISFEKQSAYNAGNGIYHLTNRLRGLNDAMSARDKYVSDKFFEYLNMHEVDENMLFGYFGITGGVKC